MSQKVKNLLAEFAELSKCEQESFIKKVDIGVRDGLSIKGRKTILESSLKRFQRLYAEIVANGEEQETPVESHAYHWRYKGMDAWTGSHAMWIVIGPVTIRHCWDGDLQFCLSEKQAISLEGQRLTNERPPGNFWLNLLDCEIFKRKTK